MDMSGYASIYLKHDQVPEEGQEASILGVKTVQIDGEDRPILGLSGLNPLVLNKTNINFLIELWGKESDAWKGQRVLVYSDPNIQFAGKRVGGVRLRKIVERELPAAAPVSANFDDDVPF